VSGNADLVAAGNVCAGAIPVGVEPAVTLTAADRARHRDEVVQVFGDENGAVHVASITTI
jgi:hypothetical protein